MRAIGSSGINSILILHILRTWGIYLPIWKKETDDVCCRILVFHMVLVETPKPPSARSVEQSTLTINWVFLDTSTTFPSSVSGSVEVQVLNHNCFSFIPFSVTSPRSYSIVNWMSNREVSGICHCCWCKPCVCYKHNHADLRFWQVIPLTSDSSLQASPGRIFQLGHSIFNAFGLFFNLKLCK